VANGRRDGDGHTKIQPHSRVLCGRPIGAERRDRITSRDPEWR